MYRKNKGISVPESKETEFGFEYIWGDWIQCPDETLLGEGGLVALTLGEALQFNQKKDSQDLYISRYSFSHTYQPSRLHSKPESCFIIMLVNVYFGFKKLGDKYKLGLIPYNKHAISRG